MTARAELSPRQFYSGNAACVVCGQWYSTEVTGAHICMGFPRPHGVVVADGVRLSTEQSNARLIDDLRRDLTAKDQRIDDLEASERTSANIITDLQAEIRALESGPTMTVVREFTNGSMSLVEVITTGEMLELLGHRVGLKWHRDERGLIDGITLAVAA